MADKFIIIIITKVFIGNGSWNCIYIFQTIHNSENLERVYFIFTMNCNSFPYIIFLYFRKIKNGMSRGHPGWGKIWLKFKCKPDPFSGWWDMHHLISMLESSSFLVISIWSICEHLLCRRKISIKSDNWLLIYFVFKLFK